MGVPPLLALLRCKCPLGVTLSALCASFVCASLSSPPPVPFSLGQTEGGRAEEAFSSLQGDQCSGIDELFCLCLFLSALKHLQMTKVGHPNLRCRTSLSTVGSTALC